MVSPQDRFVAMYSHHNVFQDDLITSMRSKDSMVHSIEELCKIIANTMAPNIEYLGCEEVDHRLKYPTGYVNMYDTYMYCVEFKFKITAYSKKGDLETSYKKMIFEIPELINGDYYYINGKKFYPIYQLLDATTYHKEDSVTLKTLTLPIKMSRDTKIISATNGQQFTAYVYNLEIQKKTVNMLSFYFATLGFFRTLKFLEGQNPIFTLVSTNNIKSDDGFSYFEITPHIALKVSTEIIAANINVRSVVCMILDICSTSITLDEIRTVEYWRYEVFGRNFIKTKSTKNAKIDLFLESFKRLYDSITCENMRVFEEPKDNVYEAIRWMFMNYTKLLYRDNSNIFNKRIRLSEYQIAPLVRRIMTKMFRVMNSRNRFKTPDKYESILTLPYKFSLDNKVGKIEQSSDILLKSIGNSNNTKYADCVNDIDIFNKNLKWTLNAPSTTVTKGGKRSKSLTIQQRSQSPTFLKLISLNATGAGDPGGTGCFTPFVKIDSGRFIPPALDVAVTDN